MMLQIRLLTGYPQPLLLHRHDIIVVLWPFGEKGCQTRGRVESRVQESLSPCMLHGLACCVGHIAHLQGSCVSISNLATNSSGFSEGSASIFVTVKKKKKTN